MIIKQNIFEPNILFLNKQHSFPKKECYIFTKNISKIKNTPVAPSFAKRFIHGVISLFHKLEIFFLIKDIKNNKLSGVVDINKYNNIFNEIDNKIKEEIKIENNEIDKENTEIYNLIKDKNGIKYKNLNAINKIISHANDKFDFYSLCDYLTEVKRAKDFFSGLDDIKNEDSNNKLIVECLNEIMKLRISSIDDESIKNIFKLIFLKFKFENIHLNKKYDFMSNFSTEKERDNFIKSMNFLLISIEEVQLFDKFDNNIKNEVENKLSAIMMIALNKNMGSEYYFNDLMQEWIGKYISDNHNTIKTNTIVDTGKQIDTYIINDVAGESENEDLNTLLNYDFFLKMDEELEKEIDEGVKIDEEVEIDEGVEKEIDKGVEKKIDKEVEEENRIKKKAEEEADKLIREIKVNAEKESKLIIDKLESKSNEEDIINILSEYSNDSENKISNIISSMDEIVKKHNEINLIEEDIKEILSGDDKKVNTDFDIHANEAQKIMISMHNILASINQLKERDNAEADESDSYHKIKDLLTKLKENINKKNEIDENYELPIKNNIKELMNEFEISISKMEELLLDDDLIKLDNTSKSKNVLKNNISELNQLEPMKEKINESVPEEPMSIIFDESYSKIDDSVSSLMEKINKEINREVLDKKDTYSYSISSGFEFVTKVREKMEENRKSRSTRNNLIKNKVLDKIVNDFMGNNIGKKYDFDFLKSEIERVKKINKKNKESLDNERKISIIESKIENAKDLKFNENKSKDKIASIGESSINLNIGENSNEVNIDNEGGGQSNIIFESNLDDIYFDDYKNMKHFKIESPFIIFEFNKSENNNAKIKFNYSNSKVFYSGLNLKSKEIKCNNFLIKDYINSEVGKNINEFINAKITKSEKLVDKKTSDNFKMAINSIVIEINRDLKNKSNEKNKSKKKSNSKKK
ncbi:hypothetical protein [Proteus sp. G2660]|uniref:hypothetical protein n=1 Tax=Proteus sp. G2660 TaxID=2698873 RepID=UPI0013785408|nr:hypothetical protein [Proteus sp. G2660]NBM96576.1 hypothetical protein [Proteus sp. G2660]